MIINLKSWFIRACAPALALALIGPATGSGTQRTTLSAAEFSVSADHPEVRKHTQRLDGRVFARDTRGIVESLAATEQRQDVNMEVRARLLHASLMSLARVPETPEAWEAAERYLDRGPLLFVWHEDGPYRIALPALDPAAAARFALSRWIDTRWRQRTASGLARRDHSFLDAWLSEHRASGGYLSAAGVVRALSEADTGLLGNWPAELARRLGRGEPVAPLARIVAARLEDEALAASILRDADSANALAFLQMVPEIFGPDQQIGLLEQASLRNDLASAAMYQLGKNGTPAALRLLLDKLASPVHGTSAAAALARLGEPATFARLAEVVREHPDDRAKRRAVLALHLGREAGGLEQLRRLHGESTLPRDLRRQIGRRLR